MASSSSSVTYSDLIELPAPATKTAVLIFCHGLGDVGASFSGELAMLQREAFPFLKVVLPTAPIRAVTVNNGFRMTAWYDIRELSATGTEDAAGLEEARQILERLVDREISSGTDPRRIVLSGFSQGAVISLLTVYASTRRLGGAAALSGYLPLQSRWQSELPRVNPPPPAFVAHGTADPLLPVAWSRVAVQLLRARGVPVTAHEYPGMPHSVCPQEIADLAAWLRTVFAS